MRISIICLFINLLLLPTHLSAQSVAFVRNDNAWVADEYGIVGKLQELDRTLLARIESKNRYPALDYTFETISLISPFIEGGLTLERLLAGYIKHDESAKNAGIIAATALISAQIVNVVLKYAIARDRPDLGIRSYRPKFFNTRFTPSFPSGHTASSFAFANVMSGKYGKYKFPLFAYASLSGYSQVYVGNHYPSDVLAGAMLGYGFGELMLYYEASIVCYISF